MRGTLFSVRGLKCEDGSKLTPNSTRPRALRSRSPGQMVQTPEFQLVRAPTEHVRLSQDQQGESTCATSSSPVLLVYHYVLNCALSASNPRNWGSIALPSPYPPIAWPAELQLVMRACPLTLTSFFALSLPALTPYADATGSAYVDGSTSLGVLAPQVPSRQTRLAG